MQRHPPAEGMTEQDRRGCHLAQDRSQSLRIGGSTPCFGGRRGRTEAGQIEGDRRQWSIADRGDDGVEVSV